MNHISPMEVNSRYKYILECIHNSKVATSSEIHKKNNLSKRQFYEVLKNLSDDGYIRKVELNGKPYYILWKWGFLVLDSHTLLEISALDLFYKPGD